MLKRVTAVEFVRQATRGRTKPSQLVCETADGETVEVYAKFSAGCDQREVNLTREVVAACLAADLELPVPEPFLIEIPPDWADTVQDDECRSRIKASSTIAFGSKLVTRQFSIWNSGTIISDTMLPTAAAIFVFDAIIQNPDRRSENPNCLVRGDQLRIIDHELALALDVPIIGWKPPWILGGLNSMETPGNHIFRAGLRRCTIDFGPIQNSWKALSDDRFAEYRSGIPAEWKSESVETSVERAMTHIGNARDNIEACLQEIRRVLA